MQPQWSDYRRRSRIDERVQQLDLHLLNDHLAAAAVAPVLALNDALHDE
jgi:hypothetical protein